MAEKRELQILLTMRDKFSKELDKTRKHLTTFERSSSTLGRNIAAAFSVAAITRFAQQSVQLANAQLVAEEKLAGSIANVAGAREGDFEALLKQASAMQKVTAIGDEEIINNQALLATFQLNGDQIQQLIPRILDMGAANAKTGSLTEDLKASTLAVGKAFTSGVGMLSRYGVAMTEAQKEAFRLADQEEKVILLTQILDDNFKGTAETIGQTFAGRVARAKNEINDLREGIGFALIPTLEGLVGGLTDTAEALKEDDDWINKLAKGIFRFTNFMIALGKTVNLVVKALVAFGDTLVGVARLAFNFGKDIVQTFFNVKDNVMTILKALGQALTGDFAGATETLKNSVRSAFDDTASSMDSLKNNATGWAGEMGETWQSVGESMQRAIDLEGFQPVTRAAVKSYRAIQKGATETGGSLEDAGEDVQKLTEKYEDFQSTVDDALFEITQKHHESLASIRDDIADTQKSIADLNASFEAERQSDIKSVAEEVLATEERIADIQGQLAGEVSDKRRAELQKELSQQQQALENNKSFIESIEDAVVEARRRAALTDLERAIEDFNAKRNLAKKEFDAKMDDLQKELQALQAKEQAEIQLFNQKTQILTKLRDESSKEYAKQLESEFNLTKQKVEEEIKLYQELAKAIASVRGGNAADLSRFQGRVAGMGQGFLQNINITVEGDVSGQDLVDKVSDGIMDKLRINTPVAI